MRKNKSMRILAKGQARSEDIYTTRLNNNVLGVGTSGSGKTTSIVIPNMFTTTGSIVVVDVKCQLYKKYAAMMRKKGYKVELLDFYTPKNSSVSLNMLDFIRRYKKTIHQVISPGEYDEDGNVLIEPEIADIEADAYEQDDVESLAAVLIPDYEFKDDCFWITGSRMILDAVIAYVLEALPPEEQHMGSVCTFFQEMNECLMYGGEVPFFKELEDTDPDSFAVKKYKWIRSHHKSDRTWVCLTMFVANVLGVFDSEGNAKMLCRSGFDLAECGRQKTALFVNISDVDRARDRVINAFYAQLIQALVREADSTKTGMLKYPCHIILDDFGCSLAIPDIDKVINGVRSRGISLTIILQSISQLRRMYNPAQATTIIDGCDTILFLGGTDPETGRFFADKAGKLPESILGLDNDHMWIFTRGQKPVLAEKIKSYELDLTEPDFWK